MMFYFNRIIELVHVPVEELRVFFGLDLGATATTEQRRLCGILIEDSISPTLATCSPTIVCHTKGTKELALRIAVECPDRKKRGSGHFFMCGAFLRKPFEHERFQAGRRIDVYRCRGIPGGRRSPGNGVRMVERSAYTLYKTSSTVPCRCPRSSFLTSPVRLWDSLNPGTLFPYPSSCNTGWCCNPERSVSPSFPKVSLDRKSRSGSMNV
jgi:hypothetical protein